MAQMVFNKEGVPLVGYGSKSGALFVTKGAPNEDIKKAQPKDPDADTTSFEKYDIADWGSGNTFPDTAISTIKKIGVLNSGLKFVRNFTLGQGIFPANVVGYDKNGNEELQVVDDKDVIAICNGRIVRRYMEKGARDYFKFGVAFIQIMMSTDGKTIAGINTVNARYCRLVEADKKGSITHCVVSGKWPDTPDKSEAEVYEVLDEYDPLWDLKRRQLLGKTAGQSFMFVLRDSWSNNDYYSEPVWYSAYLAGWCDVATIVPQFLKKAFENQITWKWHVKIPYAFFDKKFPKQNYETNLLREEAINAFMDEIEDNLCGASNASKPIFTFYALNEVTNKAEEQWVIESLDNKYKEGDKLVSSAAANSEILFALMINPNVMGAGMPGGTYAGNQGGSNIREAFLVNIANAWLDRQNLLDPLEIMLEFNGKEGIQLRYRNTLLVTLDSGSGTTKNVS